MQRIFITGIALLVVTFLTAGCVYHVRTPPPPPRAEVRPVRPFIGAIWIDGHWHYRGDWTWVPGHWKKPPRAGVVWAPGHWKKTPWGWKRARGHWR